MSQPANTAARRIVDTLVMNGIDRVFCVPGESYLAVLDALADVRDRIQVIACRHEGFRSTPTWRQFEARGYKEVRVDNGGWSDWDRTLILPVAKGANAFDADFELCISTGPYPGSPFPSVPGTAQHSAGAAGAPLVA